MEEATLDVEACRRPFEYSLLAGRWRLIYTTATDVLPILALEDRLPGFQVTNIFQEFTAPGDDGVGSVSNIIQLTAPLVTEPPGLTLTVSAKYTVRSANRIALWFEEAEVGRFNVGPALQGLLAPAVLPRSPLAHQLLLALKEFTLRFPLSQTLQAAQRAAEGRPVGASYLISYLDEDMFIGRASIAGGLFIFSRDA